MDEEPWSITRVAQDLGVTLRTIRWYEDRGLVAPERRGQQRLFSARDRVRLALVLRGRRLGFSLEEIRTILDMYDAEPGEAGQLRYLLGEIRRRRAELEQRRADLEQTLAEFAELEGRCADDLARLEGPAA
ncbi:MerR family transcriptional regulator [Kineococcus sp. NUM-3379]